MKLSFTSRHSTLLTRALQTAVTTADHIYCQSCPHYYYTKLIIVGFSMYITTQFLFTFLERVCFVLLFLLLLTACLQHLIRITFYQIIYFQHALILLSRFLFQSDLFLPIQCKYKGLLLQLITLIDKYTHTRYESSG